MSNSIYANPSTTKAVLEEHGLALKKSLGQNFLVNDDVVGKILRLANVSEEDFILEIGPGIGTLTYALLENAQAVISIERDPMLPDVLAETLSIFKDRFALIHKDALDVDVRDIEEAAFSIGEKDMPNKLVANLPYAVAATVVLDYFQHFPLIGSMTVMVQREVADRMMAKPCTKNYGAYTVKLSMYAEPVGSFSVGPGNFMPAPHVDSTVIRLDRKLDSLADESLIKAGCTMADAAFAARRKTISNSFKQYFSSRDKSILPLIPDIFSSANIDPGIRGETLNTTQFIDLGRAYLKSMKDET